MRTLNTRGQPDSIIEIDPETLKRRRTFTIPRTVKGAVVLARSQPGLEGITFKPDPKHPEGGTFFVCNQGPLTSTNDIAAVFEVAAPLKTGGGKDGEAKIARYVRPGTDDLAGLHYDVARDRHYVITGTHHQLLEVTPAGKVLAVYTMPVETAGDQEGITFDAGDGVYVPLDGGGVTKMTWKRPAPTTQPAGAAGGAKGDE